MLNYKSEIQLQVQQLLSFINCDDEFITILSSEITSIFEVCINRLVERLDLSDEIIEGLLRDVIASKDIERVFVLPSIVCFLGNIDSESTSDLGNLNDKISNLFSQRWITAVFNLLLVWIKLTIFDKVSDGEKLGTMKDVSSRLGRIIPSELDGYIYMIKDSYAKFQEAKFERIEDYVYLLIDRYAPYGEYLAESLKKEYLLSAHDFDEIAYLFSNILVIQQMFDDAADWREDSLSGNVSWISHSMRKEFPDLHAGMKLKAIHKEYFILHVAREYLEFSKKHIAVSLKFRLSNNVVEGFLKHYIRLVTKDVESMNITLPM